MAGSAAPAADGAGGAAARKPLFPGGSENLTYDMRAAPPGTSAIDVEADMASRSSLSAAARADSAASPAEPGPVETVGAATARCRGQPTAGVAWRSLAWPEHRLEDRARNRRRTSARPGRAGSAALGHDAAPDHAESRREVDARLQLSGSSPAAPPGYRCRPVRRRFAQPGRRTDLALADAGLTVAGLDIRRETRIRAPRRALPTEGDERSLAVTLAYAPGDAAPRVVAKGRGLIAEAIIARAHEHEIYVRMNRPRWFPC